MPVMRVTEMTAQNQPASQALDLGWRHRPASHRSWRQNRITKTTTATPAAAKGTTGGMVTSPIPTSITVLVATYTGSTYP